MFFGNKYDTYRTSKMAKEASIASKAEQKAEAKEAALKKQEEATKKAEQEKEQQEVYQKHNGQTLTYIPMGDSLAAGYAAYDSDHGYVNILKELIHNKMGYNVNIVKKITQNGTGLKNGAIPNESLISQYQPDFVTIEYGTNDAVTNKQDAYSDPNTFAERLDSLIKYIHENSPKTKIVLVTTWKNGDLSFQYDSIIEEIGKKSSISVANIEDVWNRYDTFDKKGTNLEKGQSDGWHPNNLGHELIAEKIYEQAFKVLK